MEHLYTEDNFEKVESYIKGELSGADLEAFEKQLSEDKELQQMVEQHRTLVEGVSVAAYREDRSRLDAIHQLMLEEEVAQAPVESTPKEAKVYSLRRVTSIAAIWFVGLVMGMLVLQLLKGGPAENMPIANNTTYNYGEYGGVPEGLPLFEAAIPLRVWKTTNNDELKLISEKSIELMVFHQEEDGFQYHLDETGLYIVMNTDKVEAWDTPEIELSLQNWNVGNVTLLRIDSLVQQIPLEDENFIQLINQ